MKNKGNKEKKEKKEKNVEITDYRQALHNLERKELLIKTISNIVFTICFLLICIVLFSAGKEQWEKSHVPYAAEDMTVEHATDEERSYPVKLGDIQEENGSIYQYITIGKYKLCLPQEEAKAIAGNSSIESSIDVLTITPAKSSLFTSDKNFTVIRVTSLGQAPFSEEEITSYMQQAAAYYTYAKYNALKYEDAENYNIDTKVIDGFTY